MNLLYYNLTYWYNSNNDYDTIGNTIFSALLQIRKKNNRADTDSIYKQIIKTIDFEDVTREFLDEIIHY